MPFTSFELKPALLQLKDGQPPEAFWDSEMPAKHLKLCPAELDRQRAAVAARPSSMHTRAGIRVIELERELFRGRTKAGLVVATARAAARRGCGPETARTDLSTGLRKGSRSLGPQ